MLVLGYKASTEQYGPNELLDLVVEAERCGFDSISASDHFHPWRNDDVQSFFVWSWLGTVGARTQRIQFGTGVTAPIMRYNPPCLPRRRRPFTVVVDATTEAEWLAAVVAQRAVVLVVADDATGDDAKARGCTWLLDDDRRESEGPGSR
jgi:hypothetical protein